MIMRKGDRLLEKLPIPLFIGYAISGVQCNSTGRNRLVALFIRIDS